MEDSHRSDPKASTQGMKDFYMIMEQFPKTSVAPGREGNPLQCHPLRFQRQDLPLQRHLQTDPSLGKLSFYVSMQTELKS